jgi:hypothetical protein
MPQRRIYRWTEEGVQKDFLRSSEEVKVKWKGDEQGREDATRRRSEMKIVPAKERRH